ncbi:MAG: restriction endonuclease subunit S [bacterium]|nr:restriction endonuclease subunit S [bacterium]
MDGIREASKQLQIRKLGEVCTHSKGKKPGVLKDSKTKDCTVPYINIKAFEKGIISEYTNGEKCNIANDDDLLMVWDGARCGLIGKAKKGAVGSTLMKILPKENINKEYLYHFISSKFWTLNTKPKGVGIPHIEPTLLWNFELVVPSLPEQLAIVSKIEELFSDLDSGITQLKTAQQQLNVYRQSLLSAGTSGMLSGTNETFVNAITIGEPKLKNNKWKVVKLIDIAKLESGHTPRKDTKSYWENGDIYWLSLQDIRALDGTIVMDTKYKTNRLGIENSSARLLPEGTVCFCRDICLGYVTILGKVMSTTQHFANWICTNVLNNKYLMYCFMASRDSLIRQGQGTTVKTIYMPDLKEMKIQLPSIKEQQLIVSELDKKLTLCDKIEEIINQSLQQAETLRQSILKKAFDGELVNII